MKLSQIVYDYRANHDLSLRDMAQKCGVSHSALANIESETNSKGNPYTPSFETVSRLAVGMGMSTAELLQIMDDTALYVSPIDELRDELKDNEDLRALMSAARDLSKEDIRQITDLVKRISRA